MSTDGNNVEEEGLVEEVGLEEEGQVVVVDPMIRQQQPPQPRINIKEKKKKSSNNNHNHIIQFVDHFSLEQPTSLVRFRGSKTIVHDLRNSQIQLEEQTTTTAMMTPLLEKNNDNSNNNDNHDQRNSEATMTTTTTILIKNVKDENTFALNALRVTYTLECLFFYGILFCFCLLTLVFLLMDIVVFAGADDSRGMSASIFGLLGTICAVPLYVHGLASAMAICGMYVCDTWNGHVFLRSLGQGKNNNGQDDDKNFYHRTLAIIYVEWATFCFLIGIPMLGFITGLFLGSDSWWNIGLLTWFSCVTAYFVFFAFCVIFYECQAAVYFLRQLAYKAATTGQDSNNNSSSSSSIGWGSLLRHAILIRQKVQFSGAAEYVRLTNKVDKMSKRQPEDEHKEEGDDNNNDSYDEDSTTLLQHNATGMYSRMTLLSCCGCIFEKLNHSTTAGAAPSVPGERLYSTADILGTRQFSTFQSWSLEKIFCSNHRIQTVAVVRPKNVALTRRQMKSSLACSIIGILLVMLTFISLVTWFMSAGGGAVVVVIIIVGICCFPRIRFTTRVYKMYQNVVQASHDDDMQHQEDDDDDNENGGAAGEPQGNKTVVVGDEYIEQSPEIDGIYQTYETYRMTIPKECFCWFVFFLEVICFLLGPTFVLFAMGNYAVAVLFIIVATLSVLRYYLNPAILVKELGSFDKVCPNNPEEEGHDGDKEGALRSDCQWNEKSRLSNILINVTRGPSRAVYIWIFSIFSLVSIVYTIAALNTTAEEAVSSNSCDEMKILPIGDFVYDQQNGLPYPTCQLKKGLDLPAGVSNIAGSAALLDYAYLSLWSYISPEFAQVRWWLCGGFVLVTKQLM